MEQRGHTWYVVRQVPPKLVKTIGRKSFRKTTGTTNLLEARARKHGILQSFIETFELARRYVRNGGLQNKEAFRQWQSESNGDLDQEAMAWRKELEKHKANESLWQGTNSQQHSSGSGRVMHLDELDLDDYDLDAPSIGVEWALHDRADEVERKRGVTTAKRLYDIASSQGTPIALHHENWLTEKKFKPRQLSDYRLQVKRLAEWIESKGLVAKLEGVSDRVAATYRTEALVNEGVNAKTANKHLSGLRSYWKWLVNSGYASSNPWIGKSLPKREPIEDKRERGFTDDEVVKLLEGGAERELSNAMTIAAFSGMRIEEIFMLKVKHCKNADEAFKVAHGHEGKTGAAKREVPIHSRLKELIAALCEGLGDDDYVLAGTSKGKYGTRSTACSKRFNTYRKRLGVHEQVDGNRRSRVNFHSFRRWFITKADQAGERREDIERVVGHKVDGQSLGLYSGGMTLEQRRKVVESVRL